MKKGISLIVLIITIIIILILAGAVIISLMQSDSVSNAREARFKNDISEYSSELTLWLTNEYGEQKGNLDITKVDASKDEGSYNDLKIKDIITSITDEDADKFEIKDGKLVYVGENEKEKDWVKDIGIEVVEKAENTLPDIDVPSLNWSRKYYNDFGYTKYNSETQINVYDNGNAQIAVYYAKSPYMSYYNKDTKQWTLSDVSWWNNGQPEILYAGNGVFLAKIVGLANIIASYDGITWHNAGYCAGTQNAMTTGAYEPINQSNVVSWWYYKSPVYYSFDSLTERTEWSLVGADGESVPIFKYLTSHKGKFVGVVGGDLSIATASSTAPGVWTTTIPEDGLESHYMFINSVHDKLFVLKWHSTNVGSDYTYYVRLGVLSDDGTEFIETNLYHEGDLADNRIANPRNIIWMEDWQRYALFNEGMLYTSADGITWEATAQTGFTTSQYDTFDGAIYVPGDGFYVKASGFVYYAPYTME